MSVIDAMADVQSLDKRYPDLCQNTVFVTIKLQPIVRALGPLKTAALPSFHALTGAD